MLEQNRWELQWLWSPMERKCLDLLQRASTRVSLLQIHAFMLRNSIETNVNILTKFIMACSSLAGITHARLVFNHRPQKDDTFLCNCMIKSHLGLRQFAECFTLYRDLRRETRFLPDNFTFTTLAKSSGLSLAVLEGLEIHCNALKSGFSSDLYVSTGMVDMYAKFGNMESAKKLFDEMPHRSQVSWTALIYGYSRVGDIELARKLFEEMPEVKDVVLHNAMIDGYARSGDMTSARSLFDQMPERNVVSWTSMIYGYCNDGDVESARLLFDTMPDKNLISWNAMIGGYCQNKQPHEALRLFQQMQSTSSFEPDEVTIVSILPAIADLGALELGEWAHRCVQRKKLDKAVNVCTALLDMYAKCGEITKAKRIFDGIQKKEATSWNAMINAYAVHGHARLALGTFMAMLREGVKPNDISMLGLLSACSHGGLVEEGQRWFTAMEDFGLTPKIEHYGCMVDLYGRAGCLDEAEKLIQAMPYEPNAIILSSFLSACGNSHDVTRAERFIAKAVNLEPHNDANYVLLRNLYAIEKRWKDVEEIKRLMRVNEAKKEVGCSVIEVDNRISKFLSGDTAHRQRGMIHWALRQLWMQMTDRHAGFVA